MKKLLSLVLLLGALAGTASAAPYYLSRPASGELTPYDWQPVYSIDGIYNWTAKSVQPDTAGARLNLSLYNNGYSAVRHQFSLSVGYETGSHIYTPDNNIYERHKRELEKIPVTLGYDINATIAEDIMLDLGLRGGYAFGNIEDKLEGAKNSKNTSTEGFTYTLTAGIKVQCSQNIYVKLAYEFTRTFFYENAPKNINFNQNGIVFGVGCTF